MNKIEAIQNLAIPVLSYSFGITDWLQESLKNFGIITIKILHTHELLYKYQCLARFHTHKENGAMEVALTYTYNLQNEMLEKKTDS